MTALLWTGLFALLGLVGLPLLFAGLGLLFKLVTYAIQGVFFLIFAAILYFIVKVFGFGGLLVAIFLAPVAFFALAIYGGYAGTRKVMNHLNANQDQIEEGDYYYDYEELEAEPHQEEYDYNY